MAHVFISYAKKDTRDLALKLADALNRIEGLTAWVDRSLRAGQSWEIQIQSEIDRCDTMIVLYSPDINRHKQGEDESYVLNEIAYAKYTARKPIIPVMAQRTDPPMALSSAHYIDFTSNGLTLDDLVQALCDEIGVTNATQGTPTPAPQPKPVPFPSPREAVTEGQAMKDILPAPFEWIKIPGGEFTMGELSRKVVLPTFWIAKYPVTNAQYARFINAGGYRERRWWTDKGWAWREKAKRTQPWYWTDNNFTRPEQPVNGVSWYEALAFSRWLSEASGQNITLPLEAQWEKAARGTDGRMYPWGNTFDKNRCNTCESDIGKTTSVRQYEGKGDSPYGVVDMAGNVWEWCLDEYNNPQSDPSKVNITSINSRIARGGSFLGYPFSATTWSRFDLGPDFARNDYGFRVLRTF